jgi:molybdopterin-guanine dinucleotide biosynthesis protein A
VDLPRMDAARLRALLALAAPDRGVFPVSPDGRPEPLCAVYPKNHHAAVSAALASGRLALHRLLADAVAAGWMRPAPFAAAETSAFANWNHPGDAGI